MPPISNDQYQIAVCYDQPIPHVIEVGGSGYAFVVQWSVCLAWINPQDVAKVLAIKGGCCGQNKLVYHYASELEVKVWETGHY